MLKKLLLWIIRKEYINLLEENVKLKEHVSGLYESHMNIIADHNELKRLLLKQERDNKQAKGIYEKLFENTDVTVDADIQANYGRSDSWAIISIQGEREDFVRFVDLSRYDIQMISQFLRQFKRGKVDAEPRMRNFLMGDSGLASGRTMKRSDKKLLF